MPAKKHSAGFSKDEIAAMKEYVNEQRSRGKPGAPDGEYEVRAKIAAMTGDDRAIAERLHVLIKEAAPTLTPRTWYGMPAYAKDGQVLCFFQPAAKFGVRYGTLGFSDEAKLDDGRMWPVVFAIKELSAADELRIVALVKRAVE